MAYFVAIILAFMAYGSCGCAQPDMKHLCVAADAAGHMLTLSGKALMALHDEAVESAWNSQCASGSDPDRIACRHHVVDEFALVWKPRYDLAEESVKAQHELADSLDKAGVCKAVPR